MSFSGTLDPNFDVEDAEDRIKKARRARENFYNEEAYKVIGSQVNSTKH